MKEAWTKCMMRYNVVLSGRKTKRESEESAGAPVILTLLFWCYIIWDQFYQINLQT